MGLDEGITFEERDNELKKLFSREKDILKTSRRDPLTLKRQSQIAQRVGSGGVGLEFKRITRLKKQKGLRDMVQVQKERRVLLDLPIIKPLEPVFPLIDIDTGVDF